jgi:ADP-ribose pyrophosphatase YjhB (NUDIX family)
MSKKDAHCSYCGQAFAPDQPWPRECSRCGLLSYQNPIPVAVVLLPVDDGVLLVRRGIEPGRGQLAFPGGYINLGESWQEAGARELFEETGITVAPEEIQDFRVHSTPDRTRVIIFGVARRRTSASLPAFTANEEVLECLVARQPQTLVFETHTQAMRVFFLTRGSALG